VWRTRRRRRRPPAPGEISAGLHIGETLKLDNDNVWCNRSSYCLRKGVSIITFYEAINYLFVTKYSTGEVLHVYYDQMIIDY
jgi:hypothetical protein